MEATTNPRDDPPDAGGGDGGDGGGGGGGGGGLAFLDSGAVLIALPGLAGSIIDKRGLFDPARLREAVEVTAADHARHTPETLGRAFFDRLQGALSGADQGTLMHVLGLDSEETSADDTTRGYLLTMALAQAGGLAAELARESTSYEPRPPRDPYQSAAGESVDDLALAADGLAALCAAFGYESVDGVHEDALSSPLDLPGALALPAYALQLLFAYTDRDGLEGPGRYREIAPSGAPSAGAFVAQQVPALADA